MREAQANGGIERRVGSALRLQLRVRGSTKPYGGKNVDGHCVRNASEDSEAPRNAPLPSADVALWVLWVLCWLLWVLLLVLLC